MSWTRTRYDNNANTTIMNNTPLDTSVLQKSLCIPKEGTLPKLSNNGSIVIDSKLRGLDTPLSKNPHIWKYEQTTSNVITCNNTTSFTRLSNPLCTSRGVGINRFQPICTDPQINISNPDKYEYGVDTKNIYKDNYNPCMKINNNWFKGL